MRCEENEITGFLRQDTSRLNARGLEISGRHFKSPAFLHYPICLLSFSLFQRLPVFVSHAYSLTSLLPPPFSVTDITSPGTTEWIALIFSSPSLLFCFNVMRVVLSERIPKFIWTHTVGCWEEITGGNGEIERESCRGWIKEKSSRCFEMRSMELDKDKRPTASLCILFEVHSYRLHSTILICARCYAKDGLRDDAVYSWTNWLCWRVHGWLLTGLR